ncbi:MAG TPA: hypothetical protein VMB76_10720 [Casimicrobiaceae bacterium]|jgi:uncharacterized membrane protein|nr:hypothetical protein [Casimicrobiaceae bacterium]
MAEYTVSDAASPGREPPVTAILSIYVLFIVAAVMALVAHGFPVVAPLFGMVGIVAIIFAYVKRDDAQGTWVASHVRWLIRTFWFSLAWAVLGLLFAVTIIGIVVAYPVWIADTLWVLYRLIRGIVLFNQSRPVPRM